jgi:hypothetical protein
MVTLCALYVNFPTNSLQYRDLRFGNDLLRFVPPYPHTSRGSCQILDPDYLRKTANAAE